MRAGRVRRYAYKHTYIYTSYWPGNDTGEEVMTGRMTADDETQNGFEVEVVFVVVVWLTK